VARCSTGVFTLAVWGSGVRVPLAPQKNRRSNGIGDTLVAHVNISRQHVGLFCAHGVAENSRDRVDIFKYAADKAAAPHAATHRGAVDGKWLGWTGQRWQHLADVGEIHTLAEAVATSLPRGKGAQARHYARSNSRRGLADMIAIVQHRTPMRVSVQQLDARPYELNTPSGIVDLHTGSVARSDPERFHTKITAVGVDFVTPARWAAYLRDTFGGDDELITYVQRLAGLAAIGKVTEHILPFAFGGGKNGKSVLCDVLTAILGDYAITAPANFLLAGRDRHETEIARLHGAA
jgi:hypothetical protein